MAVRRRKRPTVVAITDHVRDERLSPAASARIQELTAHGELEQTVVWNLARIVRENAAASNQTIIDYAVTELLPTLAGDPGATRLFLRAFATIVREEEPRSRQPLPFRQGPEPESAFLSKMRELERRYPDHADAMGAIADSFLRWKG